MELLSPGARFFELLGYTLAVLAAGILGGGVIWSLRLHAPEKRRRFFVVGSLAALNTLCGGVLLLLVLSQPLAPRTLEVRRPQPRDQRAVGEEPDDGVLMVEVHVRRDGALLLDGEESPVDSLVPHLRREHPKKRLHLTLRADPEAPLGVVQPIIHHLHQHGVEFSIQASGVRSRQTSSASESNAPASIHPLRSRKPIAASLANNPGNHMMLSENFWHHPRGPHPTPMTADAVASAEKKLGVKLPRRLVARLEQLNGGKPRNCAIRVPSGPFGHWRPRTLIIHTLLTIEEIGDIFGLKNLNEYEWPTGLVQFGLGEDDNYWLCLSYDPANSSAELLANRTTKKHGRRSPRLSIWRITRRIVGASIEAGRRRHR